MRLHPTKNCISVYFWKQSGNGARVEQKARLTERFCDFGAPHDVVVFVLESRSLRESWLQHARGSGVRNHD